ncbi:MAG: hypothetical protein VB055_10370 [Oscillospiraceae bacterium]|nr:hypothetical protein [Oscillospiraceae bacterium]
MKKFFRHYKILLSALLIALICVGGTLAYLVATDSPVLNTFSLADVKTEIEEGRTESSKDVAVKNTGRSDAFVRARVVVSAGVSQVLYLSAGQSVPSEAARDPDTIYVVIDPTGAWEQDGTNASDYYYYKGILEPGTATANLVQGVYCGANLDAGDFQVDVYAESVLASGAYGLNAAKAAFANVNG